MLTKKSLYLILLTYFIVGQTVAAESKTATSKTAGIKLTASQVVQRHIKARGGLAAWHAIKTMSWAGKLDAGTGDSQYRSEAYVSRMSGSARKPAVGTATQGDKSAEEKQVQLPFTLEMKRPGMSRIEVSFAGKNAIQVYDGKQGWKVRPFLNRDDVEPFTPEEAKVSEDKWQIDGPLLDYAAKGTKVAIEGMEIVGGKQAYKLKLTMKNGDVQHMWIDAKTFLDVKVDGTPRRMDGKLRTVQIYQNDFRRVNGVMVPYVLETAVNGYPGTHKIFIEKVSVNPALNDALFAKPQLAVAKVSYR